MGLIEKYNETKGKSPKIYSPQDIDDIEGVNFVDRKSEFQTNFTKNTILRYVTQFTTFAETYFSKIYTDGVGKNKDKQEYTNDNKYGQ